MTIPILYKSPFRLIANHRIWSDTSKSQRTARLICLLYACSVANATTSGSTNRKTRNSSRVDPTPSTMPTISLVDEELFKGPTNWPKLPSPLTTDYLFHYTHQGQIPNFLQVVEVLTPSLEQRLEGIKHRQTLARAKTALTLALFGHSPSRIQTLSMTAHQLGCILFDEPDQGISWKEGVGLGSLRMLRRLELDITAKHTLTSWQNVRWGNVGAGAGGGGAEAGAEGRGWASNQNLKTELEFPLIFIQEHQRLFRQSSADHINIYTSTCTNVSLPPPVLQELVIRGPNCVWTPVPLLSQIEPLEVVDLSDWHGYVPQLDQIPQQRMKSFRTNHTRRLKVIKVPLSYLRGCSQLEEIWMSTLKAKTFRWAIDLQRSIGDHVDEARLRRRRGQVRQSAAVQDQGQEIISQEDEGNPTAGSAAGNKQSLESSLALLPIPPLTKVRLYGGARDLVPSLEDALDAFRDNIEEISGSEDRCCRRRDYLRMQITWLVPNLSFMDLRGWFVVYFDLRSLRHCPGLRTLRLNTQAALAGFHHRFSDVDVSDDSQDGQDVQDGGDPVWMTGRDYVALAEMSCLEELQLRGHPWNIDNHILQTLGGFRLETNCYDHPGMILDKMEEEARNEGPRQYHPTPLAGSLKYFGIAEAQKPNRAALVPFVATMSKLKVITLGSMYSYAVQALQEAAGPRLIV
ncbi:hypothetical protein BGZ95_004143, partial [Linnemannia exigua]